MANGNSSSGLSLVDKFNENVVKPWVERQEAPKRPEVLEVNSASVTDRMFISP